MLRSILLVILTLSPIIPNVFSQSASPDGCTRLYEELGLRKFVDYGAFRHAYSGYMKIPGKKKEILTFIDFTKPSTSKRMYVVDMKNRKLLFHSYVAHGRNSGENYATSFSNRPGSYQSSLGFYLTENTYTGRNGYSLILEGLEKGINDKARERAIVIHGADYCDPSVIASAGRLGRSFGCPALPHAVSSKIINAIKDGSVIYIHADNADYKRMSRFVAPQDSYQGKAIAANTRA